MLPKEASAPKALKGKARHSGTSSSSWRRMDARRKYSYAAKLAPSFVIAAKFVAAHRTTVQASTTGDTPVAQLSALHNQCRQQAHQQDKFDGRAPVCLHQSRWERMGRRRPISNASPKWSFLGLAGKGVGWAFKIHTNTVTELHEFEYIRTHCGSIACKSSMKGGGCSWKGLRRGGVIEPHWRAALAGGNDIHVRQPWLLALTTCSAFAYLGRKAPREASPKPGGVK